MHKEIKGLIAILQFKRPLSGNVAEEKYHQLLKEHASKQEFLNFLENLENVV